MNKPARTPWLNPALFSRISQEDWKEMIRNLFSPDFLIVDTETTGTGMDARVIELSVVNMEGEIIFSQLFSTGEKLPEIIPEITGITDEMLEGKPRFEEKAEEIGKLLSGKTLIAWNASFDKRLLESEFAIIQKPSLLSPAGWEDAMEMYAYSQGQSKKYCKLIKAKQDMGIGENQEHRAASDCLDTLAVLRRAAGFEAGTASKDADIDDLFAAADAEEGKEDKESIEEVDIDDI